MAYTCNLLRTLPAIQQQIDNKPRQIIIDIPRPDRDWPEPDLKPRPENPTYADLRS